MRRRSALTSKIINKVFEVTKNAHICHIDILIELAAIETGWLLHPVHPNSTVESALGKLPYELMKRKVRSAIIVNNDTSMKKIRTIKPTHDKKIAYYIEFK